MDAAPRRTMAQPEHCSIPIDCWNYLRVDHWDTNRRDELKSIDKKIEIERKCSRRERTTSFGKNRTIDENHSDRDDDDDGEEVAHASDLFVNNASNFSHFASSAQFKCCDLRRMRRSR